jgi:integrase
MGRPRSVAPALRRHAKGQAVVDVTLPGGDRKTLYLGDHGSKEAAAEYERVCKVLKENNGVYNPPRSDQLSVNELLVEYVAHLEDEYRDPESPTGFTTTVHDRKYTLRFVKKTVGLLPASKLDAVAALAIRKAMVNHGIVRVQVNKRVGHLKALLKWAVLNKLVHPGQLAEVQAIPPLKPGRQGVTESKKRVPAPAAHVEAVVPHLSPALRAAVTVLRYSGARPGEVLSMRPADIDTTDPGRWAYRPKRHKTSYRGKTRTVPLGPKCIEAIRPWLAGCGPEDFIFSPRRSEEARSAERAARRKTPLYPSHAERNRKVREASTRELGERFDAGSFSRAIKRAAKKARLPSFVPYQLRHLRATELRERHGSEHAKAVLGHSDLEHLQLVPCACVALLRHSGDPLTGVSRWLSPWTCGTVSWPTARAA